MAARTCRVCGRVCPPRQERAGRFAMGFSVFVEMINLRVRKTAAEPVRLHQPYGER